MDIYTTLFEVIDMRSFSNLWFWIALAVVWSSASYWVLGVPFDMIQRAKRSKGEALADLEAIVDVKVRRMLTIGEVSGLWVLGFLSFALTAMGVMAFLYWVEFAQAVFLMFLPLTFVGMQTLSTAVKIRDRQLAGDDLIRALMKQRFWTQVIGIIAVFVTAMFGMWQNLELGAL
ncbi:MAG: component of SufBCD complex [Rhodobacteraceae bacterium]|nr:component of SufBCD complex [Paracoccaceae bacterium]